MTLELLFRPQLRETLNKWVPQCHCNFMMKGKHKLWKRALTLLIIYLFLMPATGKHVDLGRISISADSQLKTHTGYDDDHLRRLKALFQQATGPTRQTLNNPNFESAARSLCRFLTESNRAHHLAEILFKIYDKNTNGLIDFAEMVDFVWYDREKGKKTHSSTLFFPGSS